MQKLEISLSRAHKIAERLKDLLKETTDEVTTQSSPVRFSAKPSPSANSEIQTRGERVLMLAGLAVGSSQALAQVRSAIAQENHKRGIDSKLAELESLKKLGAMYKSMADASKQEGYLPSEISAYAPEAGAYGYSLTANPLREPTTSDGVASLLARCQRKVIQLSDEIAEANAPRITLELPEAILAAVTGSTSD
jgi:hypothetical protein